MEGCLVQVRQPSRFKTDGYLSHGRLCNQDATKFLGVIYTCYAAIKV